MKKHLSLVLILAFSCSATKAEQICETKEGLLGAHYRLTNSQVNKAENEQHTINKAVKFSSLWRKNKKVLSVDGEKSITWFKLSNGLVKKTAHFDHFKRSIEYQAKPMLEERWQQIRQLIPNTKKQSLNFSGRSQEGCYQQETYQWENKVTNLKGNLKWNADLKLVTDLTVKQGDRQSHWQLEKIEQDEVIIDAEFDQRAAYQETDFADIGDNESDPFLIKMINLGFIEHSSSGVYNTNGENIAIEHNH
jgi:hypothetical protein